MLQLRPGHHICCGIVIGLIFFPLNQSKLQFSRIPHQVGNNPALKMQFFGRTKNTSTVKRTGGVKASPAVPDKNTGGYVDKHGQAAAAAGSDGKKAVLGIRNIL